VPSNDDTGGDVYVFPRYLAGLPGHADPSFAPVSHWPHHRLDGACQLVITSPDHRIRIGWFGDDYDVWLISAAEDPISAPRWTVRINQNTPPEITQGLTRALAAEWDEDSDSFLTSRSPHWSDAVQPLLDAGWNQQPLSRGTVEIVSPDGLAGASIDVVSTGPDAETVTLWAGPPGWGTRAKATFTARTPKHLIAATAAALADPTPVLRHKDSVRLARLARLTPVEPPRPPAPSPLDIQRAAAARRPAAVPARSVRRWTTATPPTAPAVGSRGGFRR